MSRIKVKNFGPIKSGLKENDGFMDIRKVTTFIGDQGTGKSSVAKLFSIMSWLEKSLYREEIKLKQSKIFKNKYCGYQGLSNYFLKDTEIEYLGESYNIYYRKDKLSIEQVEQHTYNVPKIMYVPAERNFLSVVSKPGILEGLPRALYTFLDEFERSQRELSDILELPLNNSISFEFQKRHKNSYIKGEGYKIKLSEASSGIQSLLPVYLVSRNLALSINKKQDTSKKEVSSEVQNKIRKEVEKIIADDSLSEEVKEAALQVLSSKYKNTCFLNIVEEIEQNLYPSSQKLLLFKLLEFVNLIDCNKLILTTHSPYIINYLTLAIKAQKVLRRIEQGNHNIDLKERVEKIVPIASCISANDSVVYTLTSKGKIHKLPTYEGMPSDNNFLNQFLSETNTDFDKLLDIEEDTNELTIFA